MILDDIIKRQELILTINLAFILLIKDFCGMRNEIGLENGQLQHFLIYFAHTLIHITRHSWNIDSIG